MKLIVTCSTIFYLYCSHNERQKCWETRLFLSTIDKIYPSHLRYNLFPPKKCWICYLGDLLRLCTDIEKGQGERLIICIGFEVEKMEVLKLALISTDQLSQLRLTLIAVTVKRALSLLLEKGFWQLSRRFREGRRQDKNLEFTYNMPNKY